MPLIEPHDSINNSLNARVIGIKAIQSNHSTNRFPVLCRQFKTHYRKSIRMVVRTMSPASTVFSAFGVMEFYWNTLIHPD